MIAGKSCIVLVILFTIASGFSIRDTHEWSSYKLKYSKEYKSETEDVQRMCIFLKNKNKIDAHNELFKKGLVSYKMGLNTYSDLTNEEFMNLMSGSKLPTKFSSRQGSKIYKKIHRISKRNEILLEQNGSTGSQTVTIPASIDWREKGAVTGVKNQGRCGSCWAFSATGSIEGQYFIKTGKLVSFSEQNLIDCSQTYGNNGCNGGYATNSFQYMINNGGIEKEESYPYEAKSGICRYNKTNSNITVSGYVTIPYGDEKMLTEAIATVGPISVAFHVCGSFQAFRFYDGGIFTDINCSSEYTIINHVVLAVGYGTDENGQDYYILKNSWSASWGDKGYFKMPRNKNNHCSIATSASYPIVQVS